ELHHCAPHADVVRNMDCQHSAQTEFARHPQMMRSTSTGPGVLMIDRITMFREARPEEVEALMGLTVSDLVPSGCLVHVIRLYRGAGMFIPFWSILTARYQYRATDPEARQAVDQTLEINLGPAHVVGRVPSRDLEHALSRPGHPRS